MEGNIGSGSGISSHRLLDPVTCRRMSDIGSCCHVITCFLALDRWRTINQFGVQITQTTLLPATTALLIRTPLISS